MTDYTELVKALRICSADNFCDNCPYYSSNGFDCAKKIATDAADAIEELLQKAQQLPKWISVEERLPESGTRALVMRFDYVEKKPFMDILWFDKETWWNRQFTGDYAVTHWMPLPTPPKEEA